MGPLGHSVECCTELVVVVSNQKPWPLAKGGCLPQLLGDPGIVRTSGHPKVHQPTRTQLDHYKDKNGAEEEVIRLQKVNGPDVFGMVAKKRAPCLTGWNR